MGKGVEKRKKKGRPSLLDLQKRSIKAQQLQHQQQKRNFSTPHSSNHYQTGTATSVRRSTRRHPTPTKEDHQNEDDSREKKVKHMLKLPSQKSPINNTTETLNSVDSNAEENISSCNQRKRKINTIGNGSASGDGNNKEKKKLASGTNPTNNAKAGGAKLDLGPSTHLPDKKLLLFILHRLQKKDTYGAFSDPVDPNELPDYFKVIDHPMDFGTVKRNLTNGTYANLEQFEKDVFLICSNAMQYNSSDTIYFRQAHSIEDLAKKSFENLRQDCDTNEPEPKLVRRGRPPNKNLKKLFGRHLLDRAGSEFSSDTTFNTGHLFIDKTGFSGSSGRFHGCCDTYSNWLTESKYEKCDEGSPQKGYSVKNGRWHSVLDDDKRNTCKQLYLSSIGKEPSAFSTFDREMRQLMAVGVHTEYGYARSLARFAANLGPIAWKMAVRKIDMCLPHGVNFGPGWVGENDLTPHKPLLSSPTSGHPLNSKKFSAPVTSCSAASPRTLESKGDNLLEKSEEISSAEKRLSLATSTADGYLNKPLIPCATKTSSYHTEESNPEEGLKSHSSFNIPNKINMEVIRSRPPFQTGTGMNGYNHTHGPSLTSQMGKLMGSIKPTACSFELSNVVDTSSTMNNNLSHPHHSQNSQLSENANSSSNSPIPNTAWEAIKSGLHLLPSWQEVSVIQKPDSAPPDLNIIFQSPSSLSSGRVDSTQPDLALQL